MNKNKETSCLIIISKYSRNYLLENKFEKLHQEFFNRQIFLLIEVLLAVDYWRTYNVFEYYQGSQGSSFFRRHFNELSNTRCSLRIFPENGLYLLSLEMENLRLITDLIISSLKFISLNCTELVHFLQSDIDKITTWGNFCKEGHKR